MCPSTRVLMGGITGAPRETQTSGEHANRNDASRDLNSEPPGYEGTPSTRSYHCFGVAKNSLNQTFKSYITIVTQATVCSLWDSLWPPQNRTRCQRKMRMQFGKHETSKITNARPSKVLNPHQNYKPTTAESESHPHIPRHPDPHFIITDDGRWCTVHWNRPVEGKADAMLTNVLCH